MRHQDHTSPLPLPSTATTR